MQKVYLNISQVREKLGGRSRTSIYRDVETGQLPRPVKIGGRPYWRDDEIDAHLEKLREAA